MTVIRNPQVYANQAQPRMLHRADCPHQVPGVSQFRPATPVEQQRLRDCQQCAAREQRGG